MGELRRVSECLVDAVESLETVQAGAAPARGFHTGLAALDALEPWRTSRLTIVSGRASVGKTGLVLHAAWESARKGIATAVFTGDGCVNRCAASDRGRGPASAARGARLVHARALGPRDGGEPRAFAAAALDPGDPAV
jgi:hypothetical protein